MSEKNNTFEPITEILITAATAYLQTRMAEHAKAVDLVSEAKHELGVAVADATMRGLISGKNEAEREARALTLFMAQYAKVDGCEKAEREARLDVELARLDLEAIKLRLRLLELAKD